MGCKFYMTNWIPHLGRYAIITTVFPQFNTSIYSTKTFIFSLGKETLSAGKSFTHDRNLKKVKAEEIRYPIDYIYMHKAALHEAKNMINEQKVKAYKETGDNNIYRQEWEPEEYEPWPILALELGNRYRKELSKITEDSNDADLNYILSAILLTADNIGPFEQINIK